MRGRGENGPFTARLIFWWMPKTRKVEQADPGTLGCSDGLRQCSVACVCFGDGRAEAIWGKEGKYEGELGRDSGQERATNGSGGKTGCRERV